MLVTVRKNLSYVVVTILLQLAIFDLLKFKLGSEAWGTKTKEITLRLREE